MYLNIEAMEKLEDSMLNKKNYLIYKGNCKKMVQGYKSPIDIKALQDSWDMWYNSLPSDIKEMINLKVQQKQKIQRYNLRDCLQIKMLDEVYKEWLLDYPNMEDTFEIEKIELKENLFFKYGIDTDGNCVLDKDILYLIYNLYEPQTEKESMLADILYNLIWFYAIHSLYRDSTRLSKDKGQITLNWQRIECQYTWLSYPSTTTSAFNYCFTTSTDTTYLWGLQYLNIALLSYMYMQETKKLYKKVEFYNVYDNIIKQIIQGTYKSQLIPNIPPEIEDMLIPKILAGDMKIPKMETKLNIYVKQKIFKQMIGEEKTFLNSFLLLKSSYIGGVIGTIIGYENTYIEQKGRAESPIQVKLITNTGVIFETQSNVTSDIKQNLQYLCMELPERLDLDTYMMSFYQ